MAEATATEVHESPEYLRMSLAAAMTLGFKGGRFYRNAKLPCVNLLMTYSEGCAANCTYCGLSREGAPDHQGRSFIRVEWPQYSLDDIIKAIQERPDKIKRICLSMITNRRGIKDSEYIFERLHAEVPAVPLSYLLSPTILKRDDLERAKALGVERIGVAVDAATPELFEKNRGRTVKGPHKWETYWKTFAECVEIFGKDMVGSHLIVGLGETEKQMVAAQQRTRDYGGVTHLFSFYPEPGSQLQAHVPPPAGQYRRMQMTRYLIDEDLSDMSKMSFNDKDQLTDFGVDEAVFEKAFNCGIPFLTSGCPDNDTGIVACNRPFGDSEPGENIRSFPFFPDKDDLKKIRGEMAVY